MFTHPRPAPRALPDANGYPVEKGENKGNGSATREPQQQLLPPPSILQYPALFVMAIRVVRGLYRSLVLSSLTIRTFAVLDCVRCIWASSLGRAILVVNAKTSFSTRIQRYMIWVLRIAVPRTLHYTSRCS
jgi:hypothetical protein